MSLDYIPDFAKCCDKNQINFRKSGLCFDCWHENEYSNNLEYRSKHDLGILKQKEYGKKYYEENANDLNEKIRQKRIINKQDPEWVRSTRDRDLRFKYNITIEAYDIMFKNQNGVCKICNKFRPIKGKPYSLVVDHDHITNKVRGLLCSSCNLYIARIDENISVLNNLIDYFKCK